MSWGACARCGVVFQLYDGVCIARVCQQSLPCAKCDGSGVHSTAIQSEGQRGSDSILVDCDLCDGTGSRYADGIPAWWPESAPAPRRVAP